MGNQACFVLIDGAIRLVLDPEDPFSSDYVLASRTRDCAPSASPLQGGNLLVAAFQSG